MAGPFSGTVAIRAMKEGDYQATIFPGTHAGIAAALSYLTGGGKLSLGPGMVDITTALSPPAGVTVEGCGPLTVLRNTSNVSVFSFSTNNVTIQHLKIDGNKAAVTAGRGIYIAGGSGATIAGVYIDSTYQAGIRVDSTASNVRIRGNRITNCGLNNTNAEYSGIYIPGPTDVSIGDNYIYNSGASGISAFTPTTGISVIGNYVDTCGDNGIKFQYNSGLHSRCRIIGNHVTTASVDGIRADFDRSVVRGNVIQSCTQTGIKTDGHNDLSICGNEIYGCGSSGISVACTQTTGDNLRICCNLAHDNTGNGININPNGNAATNLIVTGNTCHTNTSYGVQVNTGTVGSSCGVYNNHLYSNAVGQETYSASSNWTYLPMSGQRQNIASSATITVPGDGFYTVSGTADITSITAMPAGTRIVLQFTGAAAAAGLTDGSNLKLAGNLAYTADDMISLVSNGTNWYETGRSVN